ncbi:hypothetical protein BOX15_Mlig032663g1 [Macrostomum lignano]|uniref:Dynein light chain n=1 Tax=Macrostomum lignano TaxID=282301 RepID=A0A267GXJ1_9PLAT|nr:hypothetical protein BOX15_Mlig032663g2 [Macrostomum lignano]PAA90022.1 hypothetical protein BOX15_Mlig032663g1 [Macrostomum lignano]
MERPIRKELSVEFRHTIQSLLTQACNSSKDEGEIAQFLKSRMDNQLSPTWHVIVGRSYACHVGHEDGTFGTFNYPPYNVVVFKAGL